jgi:hypothetical protein
MCSRLALIFVAASLLLGSVTAGHGRGDSMTSSLVFKLHLELTLFEGPKQPPRLKY